MSRETERLMSGGHPVVLTPAHNGNSHPGQGRGSEVGAGDAGTRIAGDDADLPGAGEEGAAEDGAGVGAVVVIAGNPPVRMLSIGVQIIFWT